MADSPSRLLDIPVLRDVQNLCEIIRRMGCKVEEKGNEILIDPAGIERPEADPDLARKLRGSYYLLGVLLGKKGWARSSLPGGCNIGNRPIDLHLKGFKALGAEMR